MGIIDVRGRQSLILTQYRLCNVRFTTVRANIDLSEVTVNARTGEFNPTSLAHVVNTDVVNELVVRTWLDKACKCYCPAY